MLLALSFLINAIVVAAILYAVRAPKPEPLVEMLDTARVSDAHRRALRQRLEYERRMKLVGALVGFVLPGFLKPFIELPDAVNGFSLGFAGLLIGAVVAATHEEGPSGNRRSARVRERRVDEYLPTSLLWWTRGLAAMTVVLAALVGPLGRLIGACAHPDMARSAATPAVGAILAVIVTGLVEVGVRRIVRRAQPTDSPGMVAIDNLLRRRAVTVAAASGLSAVVLSTTFIVSGTITGGPDCTAPGEWTRILLIDAAVGAVGFVTAIGLWIIFTRRSSLPSAAAVPAHDLTP